MASPECYMYTITCLGLRFNSPGQGWRFLVFVLVFKTLRMSDVLFLIASVGIPSNPVDVTGKCSTNSVSVVFSSATRASNCQLTPVTSLVPTDVQPANQSGTGGCAFTQ